VKTWTPIDLSKSGDSLAVRSIGVAMELIELAGVIALSVAVSLAGARVILSASLFLMTRGVTPVTADVQQSAGPTQTV
jgi:hypothetical protein